jgi:hypothetical protein
MLRGHLARAALAAAALLVSPFSASAQSGPPAAAPASPQACAAIGSPTAIPSPALIHFDDLPNASIIGGAYQPTHGVTFASDSATRAIIYGNEPAKAHSRPNVAINDAVFPATSAGVPMTITFDTLKTHVGFYLGNGEGLDPTATLTAYDSKGNPICNTTAKVPEAHTQFIGLFDSAGGIQSVTLDYGATALNESIDDLAFAPFREPVVTGRIAYVYRGDAEDAAAFRFLLASRGYGVTLVPLGDVLATDFNAFDLILVADDTGSLDQWGLPGLTDGQVLQITAPNKPILGVGEGGYAFFGRLSLFIGWPQGWHGPDDDLNRSAVAPSAVYSAPNLIPPDPVQVYARPVNAVSIFLAGLPSSALPIGDENPDTDHAPLILEGCRFLWGYGGHPRAMTAAGQDLFHNLVEYALHFQCPPPPNPEPKVCAAVSKTANPPDGTPVAPGSIIEYTLVYTYSNSADCNNTRETRLVDSVPADTMLVPGSASGGISPGFDGALAWPVVPGPGGVTRTFQVRVADTQCVNQRTVNNRAALVAPDRPPVISNIVSHPVDCPPINLPNDEPPYAEDEVQIQPYPILAGKPTAVSVRLINSAATSIPVTVSWQASPDKFGIGLSFNTLATKAVTIPAGGAVIVSATITLAATGHYCIQIRVDSPGYAPIFTQRNLDVTEDLRPGVPDTLTFKVGNPTGALADIALVVINTCPGWTAVVSPSMLVNMLPGQVRDAQLIVTPPNPAVLGSGCHIDVQGWATGPGGGPPELLGGIRKLDVPPVNLPVDVQPPWLEPEITLRFNPPAVGRPNQICVLLQNPLPAARNVTLEYAVADFGAGIGFATVATRTFTLPPASAGRYCADWTPAAGGTLHRCILVTLKQAGYQDMRSQLNVDLAAGLPSLPLPGFVPFRIGNPDLVTHTLQLVPTVYGIDPYWKPVFRRRGPVPDPPPVEIGPGEFLDLEMGLANVGAPARGPQAPPADYRFGDLSRVDVSVRLDGAEVGGFTVQLGIHQARLPLVRR